LQPLLSIIVRNLIAMRSTCSRIVGYCVCCNSWKTVSTFSMTISNFMNVQILSMNSFKLVFLCVPRISYEKSKSYEYKSLHLLLCNIIQEGHDEKLDTVDRNWSFHIPWFRPFHFIIISAHWFLPKYLFLDPRVSWKSAVMESKLTSSS